MGNQAAHGKCIREDEALETPIFPQHICQQPMISSCRDFIQIHVRAHEASRACFFCRMEGYEIDVLHELLGHIDRVVVSTAIGGAVAGKMLYANHDTVGTELCALKSANL